MSSNVQLPPPGPCQRRAGWVPSAVRGEEGEPERRRCGDPAVKRRPVSRRTPTVHSARLCRLDCNLTLRAVPRRRTVLGASPASPSEGGL